MRYLRKTLVLLAILSIIYSCSGYYKITESTDPYKGITSLRLIQEPWAFSAIEKDDWGGRYSYNLKSGLLSQSKPGELPQVSLTIELVTRVRAEELDSILFFDLDQEKIKIESTRYTYKQFEQSTTSESTATTTETKSGNKETAKDKKTNDQKAVTTRTTTTEAGTFQLMSREFEIPANLWEPIANSSQIAYRLYLGNEGIDVRLSGKETARIKDFFSRVIQQRDKNYQAIPEGQKKW